MLFVPWMSNPKVEEERRLRRVKSAAERGVAWDIDKTKFATQLMIKHETYDMSRYFVFNEKPTTLGISMAEAVKSPCGKWAYANRVLRAGDALSIFRIPKAEGRVWFSGDVIIPVLFEMENAGSSYRKVWMSLTPMEILTMRRGISLANGKVLVGGLGMGYFLRRVAEKTSVSEIIVVEKCQGLLDWYGNDLVNKIANETGKPISLICDDVLPHIDQSRHGVDTRYLVDIWDSLPTWFSCLSKEWKSAIKSVRHFWGWGLTMSDL